MVLKALDYFVLWFSRIKVTFMVGVILMLFGFSIFESRSQLLAYSSAWLPLGAWGLSSFLCGAVLVYNRGAAAKRYFPLLTLPLLIYPIIVFAYIATQPAQNQNYTGVVIAAAVYLLILRMGVGCEN